MKTPTKNNDTPQDPQGDGCMARLVRQLRDAENRISELKQDRDILHQDGERWRKYGQQAIAKKLMAVSVINTIDDQLSVIEDTGHGGHMDSVSQLRKYIAHALLSFEPNAQVEARRQ